jgi:hypothetical protein
MAAMRPAAQHIFPRLSSTRRPEKALMRPRTHSGKIIPETHITIEFVLIAGSMY